MIKLGELEVYKVSMEIGEIVWAIVEKWNFFEKDTLGKQFTRAADSIAFNISEGMRAISLCRESELLLL